MLRSYDGNEPYVFVSYAHKDADRVIGLIHHLMRTACNIWYDEGIAAGGYWNDDIARHLENAACVLWFVSENSIASNYVQGEINFAITRNIQIFPVHIDDVKLPIGLEILLGRVQAIFAKELSSPELRKRIADHLPPAVFHKTGTPFYSGETFSLYLKDTTTQFPDSAYFAGEDNCSFEITWASDCDELREHTLCRYAAPPAYDMSFRITKVERFADPYFDEGESHTVVANVLLNFSAKYPCPWPDLDVLLTVAIDCRPDGDPQIRVISHKYYCEDPKSGPFVRDKLEGILRAIEQKQE